MWKQPIHIESHVCECFASANFTFDSCFKVKSSHYFKDVLFPLNFQNWLPPWNFVTNQLCLLSRNPIRNREILSKFGVLWVLQILDFMTLKNFQFSKFQLSSWILLEIVNVDYLENVTDRAILCKFWTLWVQETLDIVPLRKFCFSNSDRQLWILVEIENVSFING